MKTIISAGVLALVLAATAAAQNQASPAVDAKAAPAKPPQLTEVEQLRVQVILLSDKLAAREKELAACQQQTARNNIGDASQSVRAQLEKAYPGFTINWQTGQLVPKPQPKPAESNSPAAK